MSCVGERRCGEDAEREQRQGENAEPEHFALPCRRRRSVLPAKTMRRRACRSQPPPSAWRTIFPGGGPAAHRVRCGSDCGQLRVRAAPAGRIARPAHRPLAWPSRRGPVAVAALLAATGTVGGARAQPSGGSLVVTDAGAIRGTVDGGMRSFLGIPYAAPPVGELRWRPPRPHPPGKGSETRLRSAARVRRSRRYSGPQSTNEDCLFLNVFTPATARPASASR